MADAADEQPIKQRKNGLYTGVSDELAANMKSGWSDTELHDLEPVAQAAELAERRERLSARFPGERLVVPAGNLKTRSNDTEYPFRASVEYAYLSGNQTEDGVLVLEPTGARGHRATLYLLPRSDRENGEFWLHG
ncbi:Xaa-Pro aminopeptidase, partial [Streptomyces nanshensis]